MSCGCMKNAGNETEKHHMHSHDGDDNSKGDDTKTAPGILNKRYARREIGRKNILT